MTLRIPHLRPLAALVAAFGAAVLVLALVNRGSAPPFAAPPTSSDAANAAVPRMIDLKPSLASYARASYYRELHGDLRGAATAMSLAVDAGGQAPENVAYVQTLLGTLEFDRGRLADARRAYTIALLRQPGFPA